MKSKHTNKTQEQKEKLILTKELPQVLVDQNNNVGYETGEEEETDIEQTGSNVLWLFDSYEVTKILDLINDEIKKQLKAFAEAKYDTYYFVKDWIELKDKLEKLFYIQIINKQELTKEQAENKENHQKFLNYYMDKHPEVDYRKDYPTFAQESKNLSISESEYEEVVESK